MEDRRVFLKTLGATLAASRSVLGANDRVQMGIIGTGMRGNQVYQSFTRNKDVAFVTACDVRKSRLDKFVADSKVKPSSRSGAPAWTTFWERAVTPMPVLCETFHSQSRAADCSPVAIDQSPNTRVVAAI